MKLAALHIGQEVTHPQYGLGTVKALTEHAAEILFAEGRRTLDPEGSGLAPAGAQATLAGLTRPLAAVIDEVVGATLTRLGVERPDAAVEELAPRWHGGRLVLHPADPTLQTKEVPLEVFFHKIVLMRNNLRVLEQKVNAHPKLTEEERFDWQQYVTRCYGSMTTFNVLFHTKDGQFSA